MRNLCRLFLALAVVAIACVGAHAQDDDSPSLGDVARQTRQQRQKDAQTKNSQASGSSASNAATPNAPNSVPNKDTQSKASQGKDTAPQSAKDGSASKAPKKVITNEEISNHAAVAVATTRPASDATTDDDAQSGAGGGKASADSWRQQISAQKNAISQLESQIQDLSDSIRYAGGNCVSNCQAWNELQQRKQQQVDSMTSQLGEQQKHLEEMQEQARRQGYGSSVYDP